MASTELWGGPAVAGFDIDAPSRGALSAAADKAAEYEPFAVDESWLLGQGETPSGVTKHDPFGWTILLIAFAGLTAAFAGKRSGGRGLIGA